MRRVQKRFADHSSNRVTIPLLSWEVSLKCFRVKFNSKEGKTSRRTLQLIWMKGEAKLFTQMNTGLKVVVAYRRRWWAQGQEIVQVMMEEGDIIIVNQNPFDQIRNSSKDKRC